MAGSIPRQFTCPQAVTRPGPVSINYVDRSQHATATYTIPPWCDYEVIKLDGLPFCGPLNMYVCVQLMDTLANLRATKTENIQLKDRFQKVCHTP